MAANWGRPNTIMVVSDFPPELCDYPQDVGGYNVSRQQTYLRIYGRQTNGRMVMFSQSLDLSNRQALEQIYDFFGVQPQPGELLSQRLHIDLPDNEQNNLINH